MSFTLSKKEVAQLRALYNAHSQARTDLSAWLGDFSSQRWADFDRKSERWQDGEAGIAASEQLNLVDDWTDDLDSINETTMVEELCGGGRRDKEQNHETHG